jgi:hypothetical protein
MIRPPPSLRITEYAAWLVKDRGLRIRVDEEVDVLSGELTGNPGLPQARRVQQHIEPAERLGRAGHHLVNRCGVADVALHPGDACALGRRRLVIRRDDGRPRLAQHLNRGRADTGCAAGDEYPPAMQWLCHA